MSVLFLACGLLHWVDENDVAAKSPLILAPCMLDRTSPRDPFVLRRSDDDFLSNVTLTHKLKSDLRFELPEYSLDMEPEEYFRQIRLLVSLKPGWSVTGDVFLGTFQYSKMAMWEDLQDLRTRDSIGHTLVEFLAGDSNAKQDVDPRPDAWYNRELTSLAGGALDDLVRPQDLPLVMPADFSQLQAIGAALTGRNLVIHGPPGTGKSQTIANLIGALIAEGKSVLFVSEKTAALDVVKRRLTDRGLGVFCLDLHSERAKKVNVYAQFGESLDASKTQRESPLDYENLIDLRARLNVYVRELHKRREPLGRSAFQVQGAFARVRHAPDVDFSVSAPLGLTTASLAGFMDVAGRLTARAEEFLHHFDSRWLALKDMAPAVGLPAELRRKLRAVSGEVDACVASSGTASWLGWPAPQSLGELVILSQALQRLLHCPGVEPAWLDNEHRANASERLEYWEAAKMRRDAFFTEYERCFAMPPFDVSNLDAAAKMATNTFGDSTAASRWLGSEWHTRVMSEKVALASSLAALPGLVLEIEAGVQSIGAALGLTTDGSRLEARNLVRLCEELAALDTVPESWLEPDAVNVSILPLLDETKAICDDLAETETRLLDQFERELVQHVNRDMLFRFRVDYGSVFKRTFSAQYKADVRVLRTYRRHATKMAHADAFSAVVTATHLRDTLGRWQEVIPDVSQWLAGRYRDRLTDWDGVADTARRLESLLVTLDPVGPARSALINQASLAELLNVSTVLKERLDGLESLESTVLPRVEATPTIDRRRIDACLPAVQELLPNFTRLESIIEQVGRGFRAAPSSWATLARALQSGAALLSLQREMEKDTPSLRDAFGSWFAAWATIWQELRHALTWADGFAGIAPTQGPSATLSAHLKTPAAPAEYEARRSATEAQTARFETAVGQLEELIDSSALTWGGWEEAPFAELSTSLADLDADADAANDWLVYRATCRELDDLTGPGTVDRIRRATQEPSEISEVVQRRLLEAWLNALAVQVRALGQFAGIDHNSVIDQFKTLDMALPNAARDAIRRTAFSAYPTRQTPVGAGELGVLRNELSRRRRQLAVRRLIGRIPMLAKQLKPCFMMSPLTVSQFLPRPGAEPLIDVVIFDEASQVFPEDAIPAIWRAGQVIVVGDNKQLPPSSFFRRLGDGDVSDNSEEQDEEDERDALEGRDSILDAMLGKAIGTIAGESHLNVHYRSRHEDLIRFSNGSFYDDRLQVYPSAFRREIGLGVTDVLVADGVYANRRNVREAERVVDLVFELMRSRPNDESIGVVALSRTQADLIEELLNNRRIAEPDLDSRFAELGSEPFFIKNLENVQGDERDHIVLCVCYGPNAQGQVYQRYGPISSDLGWRRLNVAVSRARRSLSVVHSLRPEQVTVLSAGARHLKSFLEFIRDPSEWRSGGVPLPGVGGDPDSDFEVAVKSVLTARGHDVRSQVGSAGFSIDLAIVSADGARYELGIECDGAAYHSGPAARDRDWLRQSILEGLGWCIHRVWSTDWIRNPEREVLSVESALARCRQTSAAIDTLATPTPEYDPSGDLDPDPEDEELPETGGPEPLFDEYINADLTDLKRGPELKYEPEHVLGPMLQSIAEAEGPVHLSGVIELLRNRYGMRRAGKPTHDHVVDIARRLAAKGFFKLDEGFISSPDTTPVPRRPNLQFTRPVKVIARSELEEGLVKVSTAIQGARPEELLLETCRQFGYERMGQDIRSALEAALRSLTSSGRLVLDEEGFIRSIENVPAKALASQMLAAGDGPVDAASSLAHVRGLEVTGAGDSISNLSVLGWEKLSRVHEPTNSSELTFLETARLLAKQHGLEVIDYTAVRGLFWILGGLELANALRPLGFTYVPGGAKTTGSRNAWYSR